MLCCRHDHYAPASEDAERVFEVDAARIRYGPGALAEVGEAARELNLRRVALFTDAGVARLPFMETVRAALRAAHVDAVEYHDVAIEPTDRSFRAAAEFATAGAFDGYVSVGGGSVIDTAKAANLFASYPADFMDYVNAPIGAGKAVPGPLRPHIACPTTSGTGSECTGIAIFDVLDLHVKTGIASRRLRPTLGIVDPQTTASLPGAVVACSGFDVLSHALESYTARPYTARKRPAADGPRPLSQGANPFSDAACIQALQLTGEFLVRAVHDANDTHARERMMFAATLAGIGFGNAGVHAPHGMAYSVAGLVRDFQPAGYDAHQALVPHGMSVILNAPAVVRFTAPACPERHLHAAHALGAGTRAAAPHEAGEVLRERLIALMRVTGMPNGLAGVGYGESDVPSLSKGAFAQARLLQNAPRTVDEAALHELYTGALSYW